MVLLVTPFFLSKPLSDWRPLETRGSSGIGEITTMTSEVYSTKPIEDLIDKIDEELEEIRTSLNELETDFLELKNTFREMGVY